MSSNAPCVFGKKGVHPCKKEKKLLVPTSQGINGKTRVPKGKPIDQMHIDNNQKEKLETLGGSTAKCHQSTGDKEQCITLSQGNSALVSWLFKVKSEILAFVKDSNHSNDICCELCVGVFRPGKCKWKNAAAYDMMCMKDSRGGNKKWLWQLISRTPTSESSSSCWWTCCCYI